MDYREQIERLRGFEIDHEPDGWPGVRMRQISAMCDAIESLLAENERLNAELAKYRDAPEVAYATTNEEGDLAMLFFDEQEARKYSGDGEPIKLIVKPGEEK